MINGHTRNALQGFGHRAIGQLADVIRDNRVDDLFSTLLDHLGRLNAAALTGHHDLFQCGRLLRRRRCGFLCKAGAMPANRTCDQ